MPKADSSSWTKLVPDSIWHSLDPEDSADREVVENCHPPQHVNPPANKRHDRYNLIAIGGGAAGLVSAGGTGLLGGRAALIEKNLLGGDCLNTGCVPSKALLRGARAIYDIRHSSQFGRKADSVDEKIDFGLAMERVRQIRARISHHDAVARFQKEYEVDVFLGEASFTSPETIEIDGKRLRFARAVIATGSRPAIPSIPGLHEKGYLTSESIFKLRELPARLIIIGGGPIACELGQAFQRYGSQVSILSDAAQLLPREDPAASQILEDQLRREGVRIHHQTTIELVRPTGEILFREGDRLQTIPGEAILIAAGRVPNIASLDLHAAGVEYDDRGVLVDDRLRTSNHRIFAAGDVCSPVKLTHAADAMARIVIRNALFAGRQRMSRLIIPRCTYTDPEIAHVGYSRAEAIAAGMAVESISRPLTRNDRAILDSEEEGMITIHFAPRSGKILGGTIVARHAGDMIGQLTMAIANGMKMSALARTIHPYPTRTESLRHIGEMYELSQLTPPFRKLIRHWLAWRR